VPNFIPIRFEIEEAFIVFKTVAVTTRRTMNSDIGSVSDPKIIDHSTRPTLQQ